MRTSVEVMQPQGLTIMLAGDFEAAHASWRSRMLVVLF